MILIRRVGWKWEALPPHNLFFVLINSPLFFMEVFLFMRFMIFFFQFMLALKIICWNCRGLSSLDTSSRIIRFIHSEKPSLMCLVETRADAARVDRFANKLPRSWKWGAILSRGYSGGYYGCLVSFSWSYHPDCYFP